MQAGPSLDVAAARALESAEPVSLWLDDPAAPAPRAPLDGTVEADLAIVGGGFVGLWTALLAKERDPGREVVLVERDRIAAGPAGRNGGMLLRGFVSRPSLFAGEEQAIARVERANHEAQLAAIRRHGLACDLESTAGELWTATKRWQLDVLRGIEAAARAAGKQGVSMLDAAQVRARVDSPRYEGGALFPDDAALVNPAKLAWELARVCELRGVRIFEGTEALRLGTSGAKAVVVAPSGRVEAGSVVQATYADPSLLRGVDRRRMPTYSHALATEPLTAEQLGSIGWHGREAVVTCDPLFAYYRLTVDGRILWGWVDGTIPARLRPEARYDQLPEVFSHMAGDLLRTFPQLAGVRFTHKWGGALDVSSRRAPFFTRGLGGRAIAANGFTTGVAGSRFAAEVMLDLLEGASTDRTRLALVQDRPRTRLYPPAPVMRVAAPLTVRSMASRGETGRTGLWLRMLGRLGYEI